MESSEFQVGQICKPYEDKPLPLQEHSKLAMSPSGHLLLIICLNNITEKETELLSTLPIIVRILDDSKGHLLPIFRLGRSNYVFETPFNPCLYDEERILMMPLNDRLTMVAIEGNSNAVVVNRLLSLPRLLSRRLLINWLAAFEQQEFSASSYEQWIDSLQRSLRLKAIWRYAGEQWELNELDESKSNIELEMV